MLFGSRVILKPVSKFDFELAAKINCDPVMMQFLGGVGTPQAKVESFLQKQQHHFNHYGWGWMVIETQQEKIGFVFLQHCLRLSEVEIGYRIWRDYWRQGYATESAKLLLCHALSQLRFKCIVAAVDPLNIASERVLQRIGMRYWQDVEWETTPSRFARCYRAP